VLVLALLPTSVAALSAGPASAGPATQLVFSVQPVNTTANSTIPSVKVTIEDSAGTTVGTSSTVTIAIGNNAGPGNLSGSVGVTASNGVATFSNLSIDTVGTGYTLTATDAADGNLTVTSHAFNITAPSVAKHLGFAIQPGGGAAGAVWAVQPIVAVYDGNGNIVTSDNSTVINLSIASNPAGGVLSCTNGTSRTVVNGLAIFQGCLINVGSLSAYTLSVSSSPVYTTAVSNSFYVSGTSGSLIFAIQPGGGAAGAIWTQQPVVEVLNSLNQIVYTDNSTVVYLSISTNPAGGTLYCTGGTSETVVNGVASFSGCSINVASSTYYTLSASSSPVNTSATSSPFYIGGSQHLLFATQPGGGAAGAVWTQQPVVEVVNAANQIVTTDNSTIVYLAISTNPAGGTLSCTSGTYRTVVNGVASFYGCSINASSSNYYTLGATSSPSWTAAVSGAFYVTGTRPALAISASSALGLNPTSGYTTATPKYTTVGKYITWHFMGGSALAGQRVNVMVATRVGGVWGLPKYLKSAWANSSGIVTFARSLSSAGAINVRIQWPGSSTYGVSTSKALGAYWK
jgi:hypothetical protein